MTQWVKIQLHYPHMVNFDIWEEVPAENQRKNQNCEADAKVACLDVFAVEKLDLTT